MVRLSHTSPDFIMFFWLTIAHCTSPLTTQHHSHIQAMCNTETDGSALISARRQCLSFHINTESEYGCVSLSVHACEGNAVACPGERHINRELELQMLPLLLLL